jgi:hypothetical protein
MTEMFQNMAKTMGMNGKNMKVDTNAVNRMVKSQSIKDRLRAKMEMKKQQEFELKQSTEDANHLSYKPIGAEKAEKSNIPPIEDDIDTIVASIEAVGEKSTKNINPQNNQKKKNKKKK